MNFSCLPLVAALLWASLPLTSAAQPATPSAAASAPPATKPGRRLLTPAEQRDSATPPGELRPERQVVPQIQIPLGKKPPPPTPSASARRKPAASAGAINDAAARCDALESDRERAECRDRIKRQNGRR